MERLEQSRLTIAPFEWKAPVNGHHHSAAEKRTHLPRKIAKTITRPFDGHLKQLENLQHQLTATMPEQAGDDLLSPLPELLCTAIASLDQLSSLPLREASDQKRFETAFRPLEPLFYTVFFRRYEWSIRDDMQQMGLLAIWKKWQCEPTFFQKPDSYVINAAIFGASNWRKKEIRTLQREGRLLRTDHQDKVIGATRAQREQDAWAERMDRRIDIQAAIRTTLATYRTREERGWVSDIVNNLMYNGRRITRPKTLSRRLFPQFKKDVLAQLNTLLDEYASDYSPRR